MFWPNDFPSTFDQTWVASSGTRDFQTIDSIRICMNRVTKEESSIQSQRVVLTKVCPDREARFSFLPIDATSFFNPTDRSLRSSCQDLTFPTLLLPAPVRITFTVPSTSRSMMLACHV
jgi:hypothetical protein